MTVGTGPRPELLLHPPTVDDRGWRESLYFNLGHVDAGVGVWIYLWTFPNQGSTHAQVVLYRGIWPKPTLTDTLRGATGPSVLERGDDWVYAWHASAPTTDHGDLDDFRLGALSIALKVDSDAEDPRYAVHFDDGEDTKFSATFTAFSPLWLYSDAPHGCPTWLASDRYHQAAAGELVGTVAGRSVEVRGTGDTDHSWGVRDHQTMAAVDWDYWAWCSADGSEQLSLFRFAQPGKEDLLGQLTTGGVTADVVRLEASMRHDDHDVSLGGTVNVIDSRGRSVAAEFTPSYSAVGYGNPRKGWSEGYEAVCSVTVEGQRLDGLHAHTRPPDRS